MIQMPGIERTGTGADHVTDRGFCLRNNLSINLTDSVASSRGDCRGNAARSGKTVVVGADHGIRGDFRDASSINVEFVLGAYLESVKKTDGAHVADGRKKRGGNEGIRRMKR